MSELVKMYLDEPLRPGGPVSADVHESNVAECLTVGWMIEDEPPEVEMEDLIDGYDSIDGLREFADLNGLKLHHKAVDVDKAKASLIGQLG